jgi:hypothetical protein
MATKEISGGTVHKMSADLRTALAADAKVLASPSVRWLLGRQSKPK